MRDLRRVNRAAVLRRLFLEGPLNRVALAQLTGLSSGSVTNVTSALLEEGLIAEVGLEESDGGRPRVLLQVNPEFGGVIGVEVGETCIRVEAFDMRMRVAGMAEVTLAPPASRCRSGDRPDHRGHRETAGPVRSREPAPYRGRGGGARRRRSPRRTMPVCMRPTSVGEMCRWSSSSGRGVGLPVFADNGAKALGQAEMWLGAGRGASHAVVALWGTGVGAAIFTNGSLYRGSASSAGEWGHTSIRVGDKRCRCGGSGCVEAYVGAPALLEEWHRTDPAATPPSDPDSEEWVDRFLESARANKAAEAALDQAAFYVGTAAANLVNLFNPEKIIIGGWLGIEARPAAAQPDPQSRQGPGSRVHGQPGEHRGRPARGRGRRARGLHAGRRRAAG